MGKVIFAIIAVLVLMQFYKYQQSETVPVGKVYQGESAILQQEVVLYEAKWCGYCKKTKAYLDARNIPYQRVDVESSEEGRKAFQKLGGRGVPLITVGDEIIRGYNPDALGATLRDAGYL